MPRRPASKLVGEGEGAAALARLTGIKEAQTDKNVLTVEYLAALERIGDGRATKLVIPAEFSGLLGHGRSPRRGDARRTRSTDEVRPRGGLPIPPQVERVEAPPPPESR